MWHGHLARVGSRAGRPCHVGRHAGISPAQFDKWWMVDGEPCWRASVPASRVKGWFKVCEICRAVGNPADLVSVVNGMGVGTVRVQPLPHPIHHRGKPGGVFRATRNFSSCAEECRACGSLRPEGPDIPQPSPTGWVGMNKIAIKPCRGEIRSVRGVNRCLSRPFRAREELAGRHPGRWPGLRDCAPLGLERKLAENSSA